MSPRSFSPSVRAVELENEVFGRFFANIPHAVEFAGRVVDRTAGAKSFSQRLDGSGEHDDRDIVFIGMRAVAAARLKLGDVRMQLAEKRRWPLEQNSRLSRPSLSLGEPSANVGQCRAKRLVHFERRGLPFEHEIGDRCRRHIADGVVLIGRVVDERSGAEALDRGIAGIGAGDDQDFGFAIQDDEEFLLDVAMRRMRTMPRAQHRDMRLHAGESSLGTADRISSPAGFRENPRRRASAFRSAAVLLRRRRVAGR